MKAKNMTIAALALLLAACGNEEIIENNESGSTGKVHMTFTAGMPQTRTSLGEDGLAVNSTTERKPSASLKQPRSAAAPPPWKARQPRPIPTPPSIPTPTTGR